ncbi:hypothetical protein QBC36DRAFT_183662 [Triangularia setosa]|uniref:Uncharacterized protein n=1 Tax=Triangularia setosa TaxID=2587417 RepID=A0AAN7A9F6_9PEZI|nr:hypothetical protein QBC36DRAFT_183662 [Podospora setosa]
MAFTVDRAQLSWSGYLYHLEQEPGPLHSTSEAVAFIFLLFFPFFVQFYVDLFVQHRLYLGQRTRKKQCSPAPGTQRYHDR